jgi:hypothetical protein
MQKRRWSSQNQEDWQRKKRRAGIVVNRDAGSNVTDPNLWHQEKTEQPRVETEEGTVKEVYAPDSIV